MKATPDNVRKQETVRAFIAIDLPADIKVEVGKLIENLKAASRFLNTQFTWTSQENIHLTLAFLGDITPVQVRMAAVTLRGCVKCWKQFALKIGAPVLFPEGNIPRIVALKLSKETEALSVVQRMLTNGLRRRGFDLELREFYPHLTLGRLKNREDIAGIRRLVDESKMRKFGTFQVAEIKLMKSILTPDGPIYECIHSEPLPIVIENDEVAVETEPEEKNKGIHKTRKKRQ